MGEPIGFWIWFCVIVLGGVLAAIVAITMTVQV